MAGKTPTKPTQRGISSLLRTAGKNFERSVEYPGRSRGAMRSHTDGYVVTSRGDDVTVQHAVISYVVLPSDRPRIERMLGQYEEVIKAAGYTVTRAGDGLVVTAGVSDPEVEPYES